MNPCLRCGACCASFRVVFTCNQTGETFDSAVPLDFTEPIGGNKLAMKGTVGGNPRCKALEGTVGHSVRCRIYEMRPSSCRGFIGAWERQKANPVCDRARALYGLMPFDPF